RLGVWVDAAKYIASDWMRYAVPPHRVLYKKRKNKGKLTQTQSALLRSSPTTTTTRKTRRIRAQSPGRVGWANSEGDFNQTPAVACVGFLAACSIVLYGSYIFDEIPTSENVLLAIIFIAVALHLVSKNK
ncbi:hypothetical protein PIB30_099422, partial [Stylosanthes scabra]|nr:hypothetical protein [Stylosanthes scabra]